MHTHNHIHNRHTDRLLAHACAPDSNPQSTIEAIKVKLSFHCGTSPSSMSLRLLDEDGTPQCQMSDDSKKLGFYSPHNG